MNCGLFMQNFNAARGVGMMRQCFSVFHNNNRTNNQFDPDDIFQDNIDNKDR